MNLKKAFGCYLMRGNEFYSIILGQICVKLDKCDLIFHKACFGASVEISDYLKTRVPIWTSPFPTVTESNYSNEKKTVFNFQIFPLTVLVVV